MNIDNLIAAKEAIEQAIEREESRIQEEEKKGPHKAFEEGDLVTDGDVIGRVKWVSNDACDIAFEYGLMGVDVIGGKGGFIGGAKRNDYEHISRDRHIYLTSHFDVHIDLTGEDIEECLTGYFGLQNINPHKTRSKILEALRAERMHF